MSHIEKDKRNNRDQKYLEKFPALDIVAEESLESKNRVRSAVVGNVKTVVDDGNGNLLNEEGKIIGTVDYANKINLPMGSARSGFADFRPTPIVE